MKKNKWPVYVVAASLMTTVGLGIRQFAQAQDVVAPPPGQGFPGGPGGGRGFGGGGFGGPTQMAVSGNSLFILRGNTLYRVNATSLAVETKADLPAPTGGAQAQQRFPGSGEAPPPPGGDVSR